MTDTSNSSTTQVEVGQNEGTQTNEQTNNQPEMVNKADYIALQSESTKWRQGEIEMATKLVRANPEELNSISDKKVRDAVVKSISNYSSYEEMVAVEGKFSPASETEGEDEITQLKKQIKKIGFLNEKRDLENAITSVKNANPNLFLTPENEDKLREAINLFSTNISPDERVKLAVKVAIPQTVLDSTTLAYKALNNAQVTSNGSPTQSNTKTSEDKKVDSLLSLMGYKKTI